MTVAQAALLELGEWPGFGARAVEVMGRRAFAVIRAVEGRVEHVARAANLILDLLYGGVDPLIRLQARNG